jgi:hypothetical protein
MEYKMGNLLLDLVSRNNNPPKGEWIFTSNSHQRYENGVPVMGLQKGHTSKEHKISLNEIFKLT